MSNDQHTNDISKKLDDSKKPKTAEYVIGALAICLLAVLLYAFLSYPNTKNNKDETAKKPEENVTDKNTPASKLPDDFVLPPSPGTVDNDITLLSLGGDVNVVKGDDFLLRRNDYIRQGWLSSDTITLIGPSGKRLLIDRSQFLANRQYYINNGYLPARHQILEGNDGRYVAIDNDYYNNHINEYNRSGYNVRTDGVDTGELIPDSEYIRLLEQYINNGNQGPKPKRYR
ncbi:MAG: hypothetical protein LBK06_07440 [Planctomycetaceae bacterium]|jgi:hypothetical protein|nr:hypothetical protein [Planctomycetaceae bacterium]